MMIQDGILQALKVYPSFLTPPSRYPAYYLFPIKNVLGDTYYIRDAGFTGRSGGNAVWIIRSLFLAEGTTYSVLDSSTGKYYPYKSSPHTLYVFGDGNTATFDGDYYLETPKTTSNNIVISSMSFRQGVDDGKVIYEMLVALTNNGGTDFTFSEIGRVTGIGTNCVAQNIGDTTPVFITASSPGSRAMVWREVFPSPITIPATETVELAIRCSLELDMENVPDVPMIECGPITR